METTTGFRGLTCTDCGTTHAPTDAAARCPDCDGVLTAAYDPVDLDPASLDGRPDDVYRFADLLPVGRPAAGSLSEGGTPLVDCPGLASDLGVGALHVKDEGRNPTGSVADRGLSVAVAAATARGESAVALPSTGNGAQSAAAYAGRAGLDSEGFVPSRCPFVNKAMVNVHGGEMSVVGGRFADAVAAYEDAVAAADEPPFPVGPASPYRREGVKTLYFETRAALRSVPDAVVVPAGHGIVTAAVGRAIDDARAAGLADGSPRLFAVQPDGCAPIVAAHREARPVEAVEHPDTIVGPLEVPDPAVGDLAVEALSAADGGAVAVDDDAVLDAGLQTASVAGLEVGATGAVPVAGVEALVADGELSGDDEVVVINPVAGSKESDLLRSRLMSQGV